MSFEQEISLYAPPPAETVESKRHIDYWVGVLIEAGGRLDLEKSGDPAHWHLKNVVPFHFTGITMARARELNCRAYWYEAVFNHLPEIRHNRVSLEVCKPLNVVYVRDKNDMIRVFDIEANEPDRRFAIPMELVRGESDFRKVHEAMKESWRIGYREGRRIGKLEIAEDIRDALSAENLVDFS